MRGARAFDLNAGRPGRVWNGRAPATRGTQIPPPCSDGYLPWHWSPRPLPPPRLSQPDDHRHQRLHHQRWGRMLSEDLEFLEAFVRNSNNRANGSIISVVTSADNHRTTAMASMSLATYSQMRAVRLSLDRLSSLLRRWRRTRRARKGESQP